MLLNILVVAEKGLNSINDSIAQLNQDNCHVKYADNLKNAASVINEYKPDVAYISLKLTDGTGTDIIPAIKKSCPDCTVVLLSPPSDIDSLIESFDNGADYYLLTPVRIKEFLRINDHIYNSVQIRYEKRQVEKELEEQKARYKTLLDRYNTSQLIYNSLVNSSVSAIVITNMDLEIIFVNPAFTETFGWTLEEMENKDLPFFLASENNEIIAFARNLIKTGIPVKDIETKAITKNNHFLDISVSASRYDNNEKKPAGIILIINDVSEKKRLGAQLIQTHKMEAIGTLAGGIAHDFNNILQAISGYTQLLMMSKDKNHPDYKRLEIIELSAQRAADLTKRLMVFSSKVENDLKLTDLNQNVLHVAKILDRTFPKTIKIQLELADDINQINADQVQLEQLLMNLSVNAKDAMYEKGIITFSTEKKIYRKGYQEDHFFADQEEYVLLKVSDMGHGIEENIKERIFEPFFSTKEIGKGTGLGLAMVYGIIKNHGAQMNVSSTVGKGTTFSIFFPVPSDIVREHAGNSYEKSSDIMKGKETIMLVDDMEMILDLGNEMLTQAGYNIITVDSGEKALKTYESEGNNIDLVILDLDMPGMDGYECLKMLLKMDPQVKIIISSGYSSDDESEALLKTGALGFIEKPYKLPEISKIMRNILDK